MAPVMLNVLPSMVGMLMLLLSESNHVKYAGVFLTTVGIYSNVPQVTAWNSVCDLAYS